MDCSVKGTPGAPMIRSGTWSKSMSCTAMDHPNIAFARASFPRSARGTHTDMFTADTTRCVSALKRDDPAAMVDVVFSATMNTAPWPAWLPAPLRSPGLPTTITSLPHSQPVGAGHFASARPKSDEETLLAEACNGCVRCCVSFNCSRTCVGSTPPVATWLLSPAAVRGVSALGHSEAGHLRAQLSHGLPNILE